MPITRRSIPVEAWFNPTRTYTIDEVSECLDSTGYWHEEDFTRNVVHDFAWNHPDWVRNDCLTAEGMLYLTLTPRGLEFTQLGLNEVLTQFGDE